MKRSLLVLQIVCFFSSAAWAHSPNPVITGPTECGETIDSAKELIVTNPLVIEDSRADAGGPWHMASLLKQMLPANATDAELSDFILRWMGDAKVIKTLNGFDLPFPGLALGERTICKWVNEIGGGSNCEARTTNPSRIPYKLVAMVNRLDLHGHNVDEAEGRFIFSGLKTPTDHPATSSDAATPAETVIFEYRLPLTSEADVEAWASAWHALGKKACTTKDDCEPYRQALETITKRFSSRNLVATKPNGNSIGQIRTSHLAPGSGTLWEFRQFELRGQGKTVSLVSVPTSQTPDARFDNQAALIDLLNQNRAAVLNEQFVIPQKLLSPQIILDEAKSTQWDMHGLDSTLRSSFAVQTCNGCHGETETVSGFFHVSPVPGDDVLSPFLQAQLPKRAEFMKQLLCSSKNHRGIK